MLLRRFLKPVEDETTHCQSIQKLSLVAAAAPPCNSGTKILSKLQNNLELPPCYSRMRGSEDDSSVGTRGQMRPPRCGPNGRQTAPAVLVPKASDMKTTCIRAGLDRLDLWLRSVIKQVLDRVVLGMLAIELPCLGFQRLCWETRGVRRSKAKSITSCHRPLRVNCASAGRD